MSLETTAMERETAERWRQFRLLYEGLLSWRRASPHAYS